MSETSKIKLIVDTGSDLTSAHFNELLKDCSDIDITMESIPLNIQIGDEVYKTGEALSLDEYFALVKKSPTGAKTSAPSPQDFVDKFMGFDNIFVVTLSSLLSGTYNSAVLAKDMYLDEAAKKGADIGSKFVHIFDSFSASVGETLTALKILELVKKKLTNNQIVETVNKYISESRVFFILEKYDNLIKSGRMNPYLAKLASLLNIHPICKGVNGKIELAEKAIGFGRSVNKLINIIVKDSVDFTERTLGITHAKCPEKAEYIRDEILKQVKFKDVVIHEGNSLVVNYADKNGIVCAY